MDQIKINPFVERMLDFTAKRQQAISANIANLDTPGYTAKDVSFHEELSGAASLENVELEDEAKPNGNNVNLETQMTKMTQNGLQYMLLVQYLSSDVRTLRSAIADGR